MGKIVGFGLLGLLLLLLFAPVKLELLWRREVLSAKLRLLWVLPIRLLPQGEKKEKPPKKPKRKNKKPAAPEKAPARKKGPVEAVLDTLQLINDLLPHFAEAGGYVMKRITLSRCRIALVVGGEEASDVAVACGRCYAVGHAAASGLRGFIRVKEFILNVLPDFVSGREAADVEATLEVRPSTLLAGGILFLWRAAGTLLSRGGASPKEEGSRNKKGQAPPKGDPAQSNKTNEVTM